jgi:hypothetical protein
MRVMAEPTRDDVHAAGPGRAGWRGPGLVVGVLTVVALAVVGLLAAMAGRSAHPSRLAAGQTPQITRPGDTATSTSAKPAALPADSGTGKRVVYSLSRQQVWAVAADGSVARQFSVTAGSAAPAPGSYAVYSRSSSGRGGDGLSVLYVVRFAHSQPGNVVVGFDAPATPVGGAGSTAAPLGGAIREGQEDARFLWTFAPLRSAVVVVP